MVNVQYNNDPYSSAPRRNPLKWIFIGLLIIIIFVLFIVFYKPNNQIETPQIPSENKTEISTQPSDQVSDVAKTILEKTKDSSEDEKYFEILDAAKTKAQNEQDAILLCSLNPDSKNRNYCLQELAEEQLNPEYCEIIADPKQKDDCYMLIILQGEDQYCEKLVMKESQDFCELLLSS